MTTIICDRCDEEFDFTDAVTVIDGYKVVTWCNKCAQYEEEKSAILYPNINDDKLAYVSFVSFPEKKDGECWQYRITVDVGANAGNGLYIGTIRCSRSRNGDSQYYNGIEKLPCVQRLLSWSEDTLKIGVEKEMMFAAVQRLMDISSDISIDDYTFAEKLTEQLNKRAI